MRCYATDIKAIYATSPPMMAEINVEESGNIMFECDTAASHNILSKTVYNRLRGKHPDRIPVMKHDKITVRLADGSISKRHSGVINVKVQGNKTKVTSLEFFKMMMLSFMILKQSCLIKEK